MSGPPPPAPTTNSSRVSWRPTEHLNTPADHQESIAGSNSEGDINGQSSVAHFGGFVRVVVDGDRPGGPEAQSTQPLNPTTSSQFISTASFQQEMDALSSLAEHDYESRMAVNSPSSLSVFQLPRPAVRGAIGQAINKDQPQDTDTEAQSVNYTAASNDQQSTTTSPSSTAVYSSSSRQKRERKKKEGYQPRPPNAWILYRSAQLKVLKQDKEIATKPQSDISKLIGYMWRDESAQVRKHYEYQAAIRKVEHAAAFPGYVYQPKRKDPRPSADGDLLGFPPARTPSGRLSRAGRPAARRGRAFTSDKLPAEARVRTPGLELGVQPGEDSSAPISEVGGAGMRPSTSTPSLFSPITHPEPSTSSHRYNPPNQVTYPLPYDQPSAMDAWGEFASSALHWHPNHQPNSRPSTPHDYWQIQPPMSAPATVSQFSFHSHYNQEPDLRQPSSASTSDWPLNSGASTLSTAPTTASLDHQLNSAHLTSPPWDQAAPITSPGFACDAYPTMQNSYDPALLDALPPDGFAPVTGGSRLNETAYAPLAHPVRYGQPVPTNTDTGVQWNGRPQQAHIAEQLGTHGGAYQGGGEQGAGVNCAFPGNLPGYH